MSWCSGICGVGYSAIDDIIPNRTTASNLPAFNGGITHTDLGPRCARCACNMGAADDEMLLHWPARVSLPLIHDYIENILHNKVRSTKCTTISSLDC